MDFFQVLREIVSVALQFECGASADEQRVFKEGLSEITTCCQVSEPRGRR